MQHTRPSLREHGLSDQQWRVLRVLGEHGTVETGPVAREAFILGPSLPGVLTRMERDGLMVTLRPTVVVPDSTRVRLLVSMDGGFVPTTTVMIAADDGSVMSVHGGVLRGDSTPDRLRPVITGASRRSLLRAGTSVDLSALASYDAAWITDPTATNP